MARTTSTAVYHQIEEEGLLSHRRWQVYSTLYQLERATAAEIATAVPGLKSSSVGLNVHARLGELLKMGVVKEVGVGPCSITGNEVIFWELTGNLPKKINLKENLKMTRKECEARKDAYAKALREIWGSPSTPKWIRDIIREHTEQFQKG